MLNNGLPAYQEQPIIPFTSGQLPFHIGISKNLVKDIKPHYHAFAEFTFVTSGKGYKTVNGQSHTMKPGATCLYLPHHVHESQHDQRDPPNVFCCMFDLQLLTDAPLEEKCLEALYQVGSYYPSYVYLESKSFREMEMLMMELNQEYARPADTLGRDTIIQCKLAEALVIFLRNLTKNQRDAKDKSLPGRESAFWKMLQFVHVYYKESITRETVARHFHISSPHVSRLFKKYTGQSFLHYLHQLRIKAAAHLLITTEQPVTEITFAVGFKSLRTFSRVFRELMGKTPSEYRQNR